MIFTQKNIKDSFVAAIYIHIPFCSKICPFCNFAVRRDRTNLHEKYVLGIVNEIEKRMKYLKDLKFRDFSGNMNRVNFLESIYIGGGTPSRLKISEVSRLIAKVKECFTWSGKIEISFEMNPEDVNEKYLTDLYELGINRISLGGQSFQPSTLNGLGRSHSEKKLRESIKSIKNSPINNWNLDLIFGVPNQSILMFKNDVEEAVLSDPPHISLYGLEINENTPFGKNSKIIEWNSTHQDQYREMYFWAIEYLKKSSIFQYEVSNFSKKGKEGRNNMLVWSGNEYLGFGIGAHSLYGNKRWSNKNSINSYLIDLHLKKLPVGFEEKLTKNQKACEFLMLSLRQSKGINVDLWQHRFGFQFQPRQLDFVKILCDSGLAYWEGKNLCLTSSGFLLADSITLELLPSNINSKN